MPEEGESRISEIAERPRVVRGIRLASYGIGSRKIKTNDAPSGKTTQWLPVEVVNHKDQDSPIFIKVGEGLH